MRFTFILILFPFFVLTGCEKDPSETMDTQTGVQPPPVTTPSTENDSTETSPNETLKTANAPISLEEVLEAQDDSAKARYAYRHPKETLELFDVQPGMSVVEALPGGGWYSKILIPYLGSDGLLIGMDYDMDMWPHFPFTDDEFIQKRSEWPNTWPNEITAQLSNTNLAQVEAYTFTTAPEELNNSIDRILFIRALHNLARFNDKGNYLENALQTSHRLLKTGGLVGLVQHQVNEEASNESANGSRGYLKKSKVVQYFKDAGFELIAESNINENKLDQPGEKDIVWRLPPSYYTSKDNEELKAQFSEIGESNRMTLVFKKI